MKFILVDLLLGLSLVIKIKMFFLWFYMDIILLKNVMSLVVIICIYFLIFVLCIDILILVEYVVLLLL